MDSVFFGKATSGLVGDGYGALVIVSKVIYHDQPKVAELSHTRENKSKTMYPEQDLM